MNVQDILGIVSAAAPTVLGMIPGASVAVPFVTAGLGLVSRLVSAGFSPDQIHAIDVSALRKAVAAEDAKLDARAQAADAAYVHDVYPPDTEPAGT